MTSDGTYEATPLLQRKKTPLPWGQISLVFITLTAEPISSAYIFPFINQLIGELGITGGDHRKIGYYVGLIHTLFFVAQALTTWQWNRLSDFIGRRPVILIGLLGLSVSNFAFGLSRTLTALIASRCIAGFLDGNLGVMNSILGDITDHTNMAQVFPLMTPIFCIGATTAPLFGGILAKPRERWPYIFQSEFWATYPYFLPSLVSGCFTLFTFLLCAIFMNESLPSKSSRRSHVERSSVEYLPDNSPSDDGLQPLPMSTLLKTCSVMIPITNYGIFGLVETGFLVLLPLFYSSPIEIGGLGFSPVIIGTFLAAFGIMDGIVQASFSAKLIGWMGAKRVFCWAVLWFYPLILLFPIMTFVVTAQGKVGAIIWILVVFQLVFMVLMDMANSVIFMFVANAAPNKQSLGSVNGIGQSLTSMARAIGPALTTSLFAMSKQYNILGGNLIYVVLAMAITVLAVLSRRLPEMRLGGEEQDIQ